MKHKMFSIFDAKALAYLPPFCLPEAGMAVRTFGDCVNSDDHQFGAHPEDYTLFLIGTFDDRTGIVADLEQRCVVCSGVELVRSEADAGQVEFPVNGGDSEVADFSGAGAASIAELREAFKVENSDG